MAFFHAFTAGESVMRYSSVNIFSCVIGLLWLATAPNSLRGEEPEPILRCLGSKSLKIGGRIQGLRSINGEKPLIVLVSGSINMFDAESGHFLTRTERSKFVPIGQDDATRLPIDNDFVFGRIAISTDQKNVYFPHYGISIRYPISPIGPGVHLPALSLNEGVAAIATVPGADALFALSTKGSLYEYIPKTESWTKLDLPPIKRIIREELSKYDPAKTEFYYRCHLHLAAGSGIVAIGGFAGIIHLWDSAKSKAAGKIEAGGRIDALAVSADGKWIAFHWEDKDGKPAAEVWDLTTRKKLTGWTHATDPVIAISADGARVALAGTGPEGFRVEVFESGGKKLRSWPLIGEEIGHLHFLAGGAELIAGGLQGVIHHWDLKTGKPKHVAVGHLGGVQAVLPLKDGRVVTGGADGVAILWDDAGKEIRRFTGHKQPLTALVLAKDGKTFFSGAFDKTVREWTLADGAEVRSIAFEKLSDGPGAYALALSPDGKTLAVGLKAGVRLVNVADGKTTRELVVPKPAEGPTWANRNWTVTLAFAGNNKLVVSDWHRQHRIWNLDRAGEFVRLELGPEELKYPLTTLGATMAVSPDGKTVAATSALTTPRVEDRLAVTMWDAETGRRTGGFELALAVRGSKLAYTPDGSKLLIDDPRSGKMWVIDLAKKKIVQTVEAPSRTLSLAVAPDGKTFVTGGADTTALVWKLDPK